MLIRSDALTASAAATSTVLRSAAPADSDAATASTVPPSTILTLSSTASASWTYEPPSRSAQTSQAWKSTANDLVSKLMARNFSTSGDANRFTGVAAALLEQIKTGAGNYQQAVVNYSNDTVATTGVDAAKNALSGVANNASSKIALSIRTRSGTTVDLLLTNQANGLGVQVRSSATLTAAEKDAIAKLSSGFETAVQSFTGDKPTVDVSGLTDFDTTVLSTVDLKAQSARDASSLTFHSDAKQRSLKLIGPEDQADITVDAQSALLRGPASQRAQALNKLMYQMDQAVQRGHGNADWMAMAKDAFASLQQLTASTDSDGLARPLVDAATDGPDTAVSPLLTGLADFQLHVGSTAKASNPLRPTEVDTFNFTLTQSTTVTGDARKPDSVRQVQTAVLQASYHSALNSLLPPALTTEKKSQNYLYTQISDQASAVTTLTRGDDGALHAHADKSAQQNKQVQRYEFAKLVQNLVTPDDNFSTAGLSGFLQDFQRQSDTTLLDRATKNSLRAEGVNSILLQTSPKQV